MRASCTIGAMFVASLQTQNCDKYVIHHTHAVHYESRLIGGQRGCRDLMIDLMQQISIIKQFKYISKATLLRRRIFITINKSHIHIDFEVILSRRLQIVSKGMTRRKCCFWISLPATGKDFMRTGRGILIQNMSLCRHTHQVQMDGRTAPSRHALLMYLTNDTSRVRAFRDRKIDGIGK